MNIFRIFETRKPPQEDPTLAELRATRAHIQAFQESGEGTPEDVWRLKEVERQIRERSGK